MSEADIQERVEIVFKKYGKSAGQELSKQQFKNYLKEENQANSQNVNEQMMNYLIQAVDLNKNGTIDRT